MTDNRTTELLPCPICGRKATVVSWWSEAEECGMANVGCSRESYTSGYECARIHIMRIDEKTAREDAIRIWNTRAERTCKAVFVDSLNNVLSRYKCSECGSRINVGAYYCECCGSRVVIP